MPMWTTSVPGLSLVVWLSAVILPMSAVADGGDASVIHACILRPLGFVRIIAPTASCHPAETPVHWSISRKPRSACR